MVNQEYEAGFIEQVEASMRGDVTIIPNQLGRVGESFHLIPSRYTLYFGATGSGKTSLMDFTHILAPWTYLNKNNLLDSIHWEVMYFSLERKSMFKHAKWLSWLLYRDHHILASADDIMGFTGKCITADTYKLIRNYDKEVHDLLEYVPIYDGRQTGDSLNRLIAKRAKELGVLYKADHIGVKSSLSGENYIASFITDAVIEKTKIGDIPYIHLEHKGTKFKLKPETHRYFPHNPRTLVTIAIDGINLLGEKAEMDKISEVLARARDIYGFAPVVVSQQNRDQGNVERLKVHGADMGPQLEDIFKSSQMGYDADIVCGLFDPWRYKAFDQKGMYGGYDLKKTISPNGNARLLSLHILKNSFGGGVGRRYALKFLGEVNDFKVFPRISQLSTPEDIIALEQIYSEIARGY